MLPCWAKETPTPMAIVNNVPQKNESPIPAIGPINEVFTALMLEGSKFSSFAFSSSIAAVIPASRVTICGVHDMNSK